MPRCLQQSCAGAWEVRLSRSGGQERQLPKSRATCNKNDRSELERPASNTKYKTVGSANHILLSRAHGVSDSASILAPRNRISHELDFTLAHAH